MNKKSTLWVTALMIAGSFSVNAADIAAKPSDWKSGNYFYLKNADNKCLALDGNKADSVIVKVLSPDASIAARDSALWEILPVGTAESDSYTVKNKKTGAVLSFAASLEAKPLLAGGINQWSFEGGVLSAKLNDGKEMILSLSAGINTDAIVFNGGSKFVAVVTEPEKEIVLTANDLDKGFNTFQLVFNGTFDGDIFSAKELIVTDREDGYVCLQEKGNETYANGVKKYLGVDTLKTTISGAEGAYGYKFSNDSVRTASGKENTNYKRFKFLKDLKNDALTLFVKNAPGLDSDKEAKVVYAKLDNKNVLTVEGQESTLGLLPSVSVRKATPANIPTGVYFLKSASKGVNGGKYILNYDKMVGIQVMNEGKPSVFQASGQWYVRTEAGLSSVVDRQKNTDLLLVGEVYPVKDMANTYTFGSNTDSVTLEVQQINLSDRYLGSLHFTKKELSDNGYVLSLIPGIEGVDALYAFSDNKYLKVKVGDINNAAIFKFMSYDSVAVGGAKSLNDTLFVASYTLTVPFGSEVVNGTDKLKLSTEGVALPFRFVMNRTGEKYTMLTGRKYVSTDPNTSNMLLSDSEAYFKIEAVNAPEYVSLTTGHKRITSDAKSLTMNPKSLMAELKIEGQEILKSGYTADNFSLWLEESKVSVPGKPLFFISTGLPVVTEKSGTESRYYLVSSRDSARKYPSLIVDNHYRANFIRNEAIETMKESPALFAFKTTEDGGYLLENQKELAAGGTPYVGIVNNVVVMSKSGAVFTVDNAPVPTQTEKVEATQIKVIGGLGELTIVNAGGKKITLSNILGQTVGARTAGSDFFKMAANRGIFIVSIEGEPAQKVIVK